jgi:hypothetical protein
MINITLNCFGSAALLRLPASEVDYVTFRDKVRYRVTVSIDDVSIVKEDARGPDLAGQLLAWLVSLGQHSSQGYISFGDESFFYFLHDALSVSFFVYDPEHITDATYANYLGSVVKSEVMDAVLRCLVDLRATLKGCEHLVENMNGPPFLRAIQFLLLGSPNSGETEIQGCDT